ncbi:NYN domain-containing protein [Mycolicibacterium porcinum]|uniref:NYN domain-containing protein n=1 Tax=Mycolicibacterium porcinum TaxID=39693 RepID=UPI0031F9B163
MRWIVDGMNVIGSKPDGWWKDRRGAMAGLVERLERWAAAEDRRVTVVFEGPTTPPIKSDTVEVTHAPRAHANSADDEIVRLVHADSGPGEITVVTSDGALAERVRARGALVRPAAGFRDLIDAPH